MMESADLSTTCIHGGALKDSQGSPQLPLYDSSTFSFPSTRDLLDVVEGRKAGNLYTRYGLNPTIRDLEAKLAHIEGAEASLAFCSGMAAEAALFLTHGRKGVVCIGDAYGGTLELIKDQLPQLGIPTQLILGSELEKLEDGLKRGASLIFFETPTNPVLEIIDIRKVVSLAHEYGAYVAVDNTFATPVNQLPLKIGADFAVHSATKYLGGHSDIVAGAIMASKKLLEPVWNWRKNLGQMPAASTAHLLSRSLRTLVVRVTRQNETALTLAKAMLEHPRVSRVLYPGLRNFPGYDLAMRQMTGFGGVLTLELEGGYEDTVAAVDKLKLFAIAPSLGSVESLVTQPVTTTHHGLTREERQHRGISDSMIRLSVGLEAPSDLLADLRQALET